LLFSRLFVGVFTRIMQLYHASLKPGRGRGGMSLTGLRPCGKFRFIKAYVSRLIIGYTQGLRYSETHTTVIRKLEH
jgi:hypothetical protein